MDLTALTPPRYLLLDGRAFKLLGKYTGPGYVAAAIAHMERVPTAALLVDQNGTAFVADVADEGRKMQGGLGTRYLRCCCCGTAHTGRQWHNQDTGHGLGACCIDYCMRSYTVEEFERTYGLRGVHFDLEG